MNVQTNVGSLRRSARLAAVAAGGDDEQVDDRAGPRVGRFDLISEVADRSESRGLSARGLRVNLLRGDLPSREETEEGASAYCIQSIPRSRWRSLGCDAATRRKYIYLQNHLRSLISELQTHPCEGRGVSLTIRPVQDRQLKENLGHVLPHRQLMCPLWDDFASALMKYDGLYNTMFVGFVSLRLHPTVIKVLNPALTAQGITSLLFCDNDLQSTELLLISDLVRAIPTLEAFSISRNRLDASRGEEVLGKLSAAIREHPNLQRLSLTSCSIGDNKNLLSCIKNRSLTKVDLGSNMMSSIGAYAIAKVVANASKKNHRLTQLCLQDNNFSDSEAHLFASALRTNNTLQVLDLGENKKITEKGGSILRRALYDVSGFNAMFDCNHTCKVRLSHAKWVNRTTAEWVDDLNNPRHPLLYGFKSKLLLLMLTLPSNLRLTHFEDLPVELVPEAVQLIQFKSSGFDENRRIEQAHALIFDLLRAMPCIFVAKNHFQLEISKPATRARKRAHELI